MTPLYSALGTDSTPLTIWLMMNLPALNSPHPSASIASTVIRKGSVIMLSKVVELMPNEADDRQYQMLDELNGPQKALANSASRPTMNVKPLTNPPSRNPTNPPTELKDLELANCRRDPRRDAVDEHKANWATICRKGSRA